MTAPRRKPLATIDGREVYSLEIEKWVHLRRTIRRYYAWVNRGRPLDPWQSGVASSSRYDRIQIKHHKPHGGYDAGRCAEMELEAELVELDERVSALSAREQALLYWRMVERVPLTTCADRLADSVDSLAEQWSRLGVKLYYRLR